MDLDIKRVRLERLIKWGGGAAVVIVAGSVAMMVLSSIIAIAAAAVVGLVAINVLPVAARRLASWRVEQLRADAMRNPIPELIRQYEAEVVRFKSARERVIKFNAAARNFATRIGEYEKRGVDPAGLADMRNVYDDMRRVLTVQTEALAVQLKALQDFREQIDDFQDKWNMAMDIQNATAQTNEFTDQDPTQRVLRRDALSAVTTRLNEGFAALETSLRVDYRALPRDMANAQPAPLEQLESNLMTLEVQ